MAESIWLRKAHVGPDRRSDSRSICAGATVIDVLNPQPRSSVQAHILDVATSSLKLSLPFFLSPGSLIRIHMTDSVADAEVRYCTCEGSEYHVGVKVEEIVPKDG
jgi:hypothetical protein